MFEMLEGRRLLSAAGHDNFSENRAAITHGQSAPFDATAFGRPAYVQSGGTLTINNAHDLQVFEDNGVLVVNDWSVGGSTAERTSFTGVTTLVINGTEAGDIISTGLETVNATINAGGGNDQLQISDLGTGSTVVYGGAGNDNILVGTYHAGGTKVFGETGADVFSGPDGVFVQ
jgi:Ca2+-binding RTX toxin-like protein